MMHLYGRLCQLSLCSLVGHLVGHSSPVPLNVYCLPLWLADLQLNLICIDSHNWTWQSHRRANQPEKHLFGLNTGGQQGKH